MRLTDITDTTATMMVHINTVLPERLHAIRDAMGGLRAQHYEPVRSGASVVWCWAHEQEVARCHREIDATCTGETVTLADPTGETAIAYDQARVDRRELERNLRAAHRAIRTAQHILDRYTDRLPTSDRAGIGHCTDCNHYCDGTRTNRLTLYRGGDPVCRPCWAKRDRIDRTTA